MTSKSVLNMEIEKLEDEIHLLKEGNYDLLYTNAFLQEDKTDLENQIVEAKKKADYYEAHYNVNYEIWLKQTKQIVEAVKILNEPNTLNSYCLNNQIKKLREALK